MSRNLVIAVVVILVLAALAYFMTRPQQSVAPTTETETQTSTESAAEDATSEAEVEESMVSITSSGFSPKEVTIKAGQSITWENEDSSDHTVNSVPHPTHTLYPFLNVGTLKPGEKKTLMFEKAGVYRYHDHLNPSLTGTVTVQ